jgi:hypothetical protein
MTILTWNENNKHGIFRSGWNPFSGLNITFKEEIQTHAKVTVIIEPPAPGPLVTGIMAMTCSCIFMVPIVRSAEAYGFYFVRNEQSGRIDMTFRLKPFYGSEDLFVNKGCTHLEVAVEKLTSAEGIACEAIVFVLSSSVGESNLPTGISAKNKEAFKKLTEIANIVNDLINSIGSAPNRQESAYPLLDIENDTSRETGYPSAEAELPPAIYGYGIQVATVDLESLTPQRSVRMKRRSRNSFSSYCPTEVCSGNTSEDLELDEMVSPAIILHEENIIYAHAQSCSQRLQVPPPVVFMATCLDDLDFDPAAAAEGSGSGEGITTSEREGRENDQVSMVTPSPLFTRTQRSYIYQSL